MNNMDEQLIQQRAAILLLERGVRFNIVDAPFWLKILRLNRITISALRAGTIAEYSLVILQKQLDLRVADREYLCSEIDSICRIIAIAMLNSPLKIRFLTKYLARLLKWKMPYSELIRIFLTLVEINNAVDFTTITTWMNSQMTMLMSPKMGHEEKGS